MDHVNTESFLTCLKKNSKKNAKIDSVGLSKYLHKDLAFWRFGENRKELKIKRKNKKKEIKIGQLVDYLDKNFNNLKFEELTGRRIQLHLSTIMGGFEKLNILSALNLKYDFYLDVLGDYKFYYGLVLMDFESYQTLQNRAEKRMMPLIKRLFFKKEIAIKTERDMWKKVGMRLEDYQAIIQSIITSVLMYIY